MPKWTMHVEARPGHRLIIGDAGRPEIWLRISAKGIPGLEVMTGSKPEHGAGGFECPVYSAGWHTLSIDRQEFEFVPFPDATTWVSLELSEPEVSGPPPAPFDPVKDLAGDLSEA